MNDDDTDDSSKVGYSKPPAHSRFQPGRSGNPKGRPRGVRNLRTEVTRMLQIPVKVTERGRIKTMSTQTAVMLRLREKALKGDARSLDRLVDLARLYTDEGIANASCQAMSPEDEAILASYKDEVLARGPT